MELQRLPLTPKSVKDQIQPMFLRRRRRRAVPDLIQKYYIPLSVIQATDVVMRRFGQEGRECYVWWSGYFTAEGEGQVLTALCPEIQSDFGSIRLSNSELISLHSCLRTLDQVLLVELHTHPPGAGGQNTVDAAHPASTHSGFISVVVPNFAFPRFYDLRKAFVYEYLGYGRWRKLKRPDVERRFTTEETFISVEV